MDAGNLLKPLLARGELHCIGATTLDEYRKYIEKDAALERRFQPVTVDEPNVEDTVSILRGLKERYEIFHGVSIHDQALIAAATLSNRYITDRFLPDKAIDLVDEACAMIRTEIDSMPQEMDEISRRIMQLEIEETALKKETDELSRNRLEDIQKELSDLREKFRAMKAQWENEKKSINEVSDIKAEIEKTNAEIEAAQRKADYELAAKLRYSKLPELNAKLAQAQQNSESKHTTLLRDTVTEEEIAKVVSRWTGIPLSKLMEGEREKILHLERRSPQARHRTGRGSNQGQRGHHAFTRRHCGPQPTDRLLYVSRSDGSRQDGACKGACRVSFRRRTQSDKNRYVRIYGEVFRLPPCRRASRICGL